MSLSRLYLIINGCVAKTSVGHKLGSSCLGSTPVYDQVQPLQVASLQKKYLNNIVEQDHRGIKRLIKPGMGFGSFNTAPRTIGRYEIMNMMRKGQIQGVGKGVSKQRVQFIAEIFGVAT